MDKKTLGTLLEKVTRMRSRAQGRANQFEKENDLRHKIRLEDWAKTHDPRDGQPNKLISWDEAFYRGEQNAYEHIEDIIINLLKK